METTDRALPHCVVVVLNWRNPSDTIACLQSLKALEYPNYHILVIDNGSGDDSVCQLQVATEAMPRITLLETGENLGFSGGVNYGIEWALAQAADYIWLLNNDTTVAPNCLSALIKAMEQESTAAIAGCKIFLADQPEVIWHAGARFSRLGKPCHLGMGATASDTTYQANRWVEFVTGCSLLVRCAALPEIGNMDDRFYLYYEEADLCYRARKQDWKVLYVADSQLWHKVAGASAGYAHRAYYEVRNRLLFTQKHRPWALPFVLSYLILNEVCKPWVKGQTVVARAAWLGLQDFMQQKFGKLLHEL